jgi:hypothetical protein
MTNIKSSFSRETLIMILSITLICTFPFATGASAQRSAVIDPGTTIHVRTIDDINTKDADGRVFPGVVDEDVMNRNRRIVIPRGSDVELVVRNVSDNNDVALDLDSIMVNGERYSVEADPTVLESERKEGPGVNKRTGKYVGGGAVLGAIIGGIAGGGKGAAIGAGAGAAAGAGTQVLTRGKSVKVPAESLLTFRLTEPLRAGIVDTGYRRSGIHYHSIPNDDGRYTGVRQKPGYSGNEYASISIGRDKYIRWNGLRDGRVYVQVDNNPLQLFASGDSGTQEAPWIEPGHVYTFILMDQNGHEISRDVQDFRRGNRR